MGACEPACRLRHPWAVTAQISYLYYNLSLWNRGTGARTVTGRRAVAACLRRPAMSSGTAGPLGAIHPPRLWEKLTLANAGLLPEDYDECGAGFDQMALDALTSTGPKRLRSSDP
jgi:hypothetical protein